MGLAHELAQIITRPPPPGLPLAGEVTFWLASLEFFLFTKRRSPWGNNPCCIFRGVNMFTIRVSLAASAGE